MYNLYRVWASDWSREYTVRVWASDWSREYAVTGFGRTIGLESILSQGVTLVQRAYFVTGFGEVVGQLFIKLWDLGKWLVDYWMLSHGLGKK